MVKLDIFLFPFVLLLRVSLLVMSLSFAALKCIKHLFCTAVASTQSPYDYFFHPFENSKLRTELTNTIIWLWYVGLSVFLTLLYWTYRVISFGCCWSRPICIALAFWPKLFLLLLEPNSSGRSLFQIFTDPTNVGKPKRVSIHQSN